MFFLENVWLVPALPALGFLLTLFLGKRVLGPQRAHWIGIPLVAAAFVLALITAGAWVDHRDNAPVAGEAGELSFVDPSCSQAAASVGSTGEGGEAGHGDGEHALGGRGMSRSAPSAAFAEEGEEIHPTAPVVRCVSWFDTGDHTITIGTIADGQSILLLVIVTLVSLLVHIYSSDYVKGDRRYTHYYAFLSLFTASMLFFVLAENTLQMIVGWELVGVCSFVLIGHWWEDKPNSDAALKAFLTNRVGDVGLLVGVIVLYFAAGQSFSMLDLNIGATEGTISHTLLQIGALCLIAAVMSKSGQFILHTWLPDAMAGPTPVSALIHAATMVVAGIYMVARLYPVFFNGLSIGGSSINALMIVGAVTALFGAFLAFVQNDIKKVLAYSTVSQLGFMVTALGVGAWTAALFHLFTHAMFKACLFLGAGSVSHAAHHSFDMVKDMGGLRKKMPVTFWTFLIGSFALAGIWPLSGFWSKDEILAGTGSIGDGVGDYHVALVMLLLGAACTAAYMTRTIWYTFFGEYRGHGTPHESGRRITIPLVILAFLGVIVGWSNLPGAFDFLPSSLLLRFEHFVEPVGVFFPGPDSGFTHAEFNTGLAIGSVLIAVGAFALMYVFYFQGGLKPLHGLAERSRVAGFFKNILVNKYYFDWLYTDVIVGGVKGPIAKATYWFNQKVLDGVVDGVGKTAVAVGDFTYDTIDQTVIDGAVDGSAAIAQGSGSELRRTQTGRVQQYAALLFAAAAIFAGVLMLVLS